MELSWACSHVKLPRILPRQASNTTCPTPPSPIPSQLLTFLEERPSHPGHVAIVSASGCSQEELREECVVIDLDAVQLMDHSPALGEAVLNRTGDTHWGIQGSTRGAGGHQEGSLLRAGGQDGGQEGSLLREGRAATRVEDGTANQHRRRLRAGTQSLTASRRCLCRGCACCADGDAPLWRPAEVPVSKAVPQALPRECGVGVCVCILGMPPLKKGEC